MNMLETNETEVSEKIKEDIKENKMEILEFKNK